MSVNKASVFVSGRYLSSLNPIEQEAPDISSGLEGKAGLSLPKSVETCFSNIFF